MGNNHGKKSIDPSKICPICHGTTLRDSVTCEACLGSGLMETRGANVCSKCCGKCTMPHYEEGRIIDVICDKCLGKGFIVKLTYEEMVSMKIIHEIKFARQ